MDWTWLIVADIGETYHHSWFLCQCHNHSMIDYITWKSTERTYTHLGLRMRMRKIHKVQNAGNIIYKLTEFIDNSYIVSELEMNKWSGCGISYHHIRLMMVVISYSGTGIQYSAICNLNFLQNIISWYAFITKICDFFLGSYHIISVKLRRVELCSLEMKLDELLRCGAAVRNMIKLW